MQQLFLTSCGNENGMVWFQCNICSAQLGNANALVWFQCNICSWFFLNSLTLIRMTKDEKVLAIFKGLLL
jgi:hypothetical protein